MWGFAAGTLSLIVIYTLVQPGSADKVATGTGVLASLLSRMLSEGVAGLPKTKAAKTSSAGKPPPAGVNFGDPNSVAQWLLQQGMLNNYAKNETPPKNVK